MSTPTPGDKIRPANEDKQCPRCGGSKRLHAKPHCESPTCTWARCDKYSGGCGALYELYGTGSVHADDWKE